MLAHADLVAAAQAMRAAAALAPHDPVTANLARDLEQYAANLFDPS